MTDWKRETFQVYTQKNIEGYKNCTQKEFKTKNSGIYNTYNAPLLQEWIDGRL